jgi:hypothetical protein
MTVSAANSNQKVLTPGAVLIAKKGLNRENT